MSSIFTAAFSIISKLYLTARSVCSLAAKPCRSISAVNLSIRSIFVTISPNRWIGSPEGTHGLAADALLRSRSQSTLLNQVHFVPKEVSEAVFDPNDIKQGKRVRLVKRSKQINIRTGAGLIAGNRPNSARRTMPADVSSGSCARSVARTRRVS